MKRNCEWRGAYTEMSLGIALFMDFHFCRNGDASGGVFVGNEKGEIFDLI